jgi:hypothetical protein
LDKTERFAEEAEGKQGGDADPFIATVHSLIMN